MILGRRIPLKILLRVALDFPILKQLRLPGRKSKSSRSSEHLPAPVPSSPSYVWAMAPEHRERGQKQNRRKKMQFRVEEAGEGLSVIVPC